MVQGLAAGWSAWRRSTPTPDSPTITACTPCAGIFERLDDAKRAVDHFRKAADRTASILERDYLLMKASRLTNPS